ncbi:MAG: RNA polymerase sigma factor [Verrucomicrobia bacterium]|nr:MAG: RNA polymerase sigma factor [Verrucomicrobiota bacterium]
MAGPTPEEDLQMVQAVLARDEAMAAALVERIHPVVSRIVRAHRLRRVDEEDLSQMVYLRVFSKLEQYSGRAPLEHWVARVALTTCRNQLKHELRRPELRRADLTAEQDEVLDLLATTDEDLPAHAASASRELVDLLLGELSPEDRLIMSLLYLEGRSLEEVGQATGRSVGSIKLRAFRARRRLRKSLDRLLQERLP